MSRITKLVLIAVVLLTCLLVSIRLSEYRPYFAQLNAITALGKLLLIFAVYVSFILFYDRFAGNFGPDISRTGFICGCASGLLEILTIASENDVLVFRVPQSFGLLSVFVIWGIAGSLATRTSGSIKAGLLTSITSAGTCMLIGVAGGSAIEMFIAPTSPALVATWQEFKRSASTDPVAFQIANTLDSAYSHLLLAPVVATVVGAMGSLVGRLWSIQQTQPPSRSR